MINLLKRLQRVYHVLGCMERLAALRSKGPFNLKQWQAIRDPSKQYEILSQNFQKLGQGGSDEMAGREAFLLSNRFVLKWAPNEAAMAQSKAEASTSRVPAFRAALSPVQAAAPDGRWLIAELVRPISSWGEFERIKGYHRGVLGIVIRDARIPSEEEMTSAGFSTEEMKRVENDREFLQSVIALRKHGVNRQDMMMEDHWGKTSDGRIVLLDYGLDTRTQQHYQELSFNKDKDVSTAPSKGRAQSTRPVRQDNNVATRKPTRPQPMV